MTATAAAYCASNPIVYIQVVTRKSPAAPIFRLTALPSPPPSNISSLETSPLKEKRRSDSHENTRRPTPAIALRRLPTTTDQRDPSFNETEIEQILAGVGLRRRTTRRVAPPPQRLRPLTKRLAVPVCLLPLKTNAERIRHALSIVLPYLKFLSITHDLESFCLTDASIFVETLPARSVLTTTTKTTIKRKTKRHFTSKADFVASAGESLHPSATGIPMNKYVRSALNCHVMLDRLDEFAIDQIMKNSNRPLNRNTSLRAISQQLAVKTPSNRHALNGTTTKTTTTRTTITTLTTEKTTVKQKSTRTSFNPAKRLKTSNDDCVLLSSSSSSSASSYQRIYLKCFICSKREYIDARLTTSDALHLHWLEHGNDLSLNIYDSVIDSMLTRVVEFFHFPKQHALEGKIQTVFILNSEEVRQSRALPASADDACIVLD